MCEPKPRGKEQDSHAEIGRALSRQREPQMPRPGGLANLMLGPFHVCLWLPPCPLMPVLGTGLVPNAEPLCSLRIKAQDLKQVVMIGLVQ